MVGNFFKLYLLSIIIISAGTVVFGQTDASMRSSSDRRKSNEHETKTVVEMLTKQRLLKEKKDHEEMLKRGEDALTLSKLLEEAFEKNQDISEPDKQKLAALEKLVTKIRKELGGDDDGEGVELAAVTESKPSTLKEAFTYLQTTTVKLVDELKKTSRFSISVVAIQSSNTVLKLVRFLRLRQ